MHVWIIIGNQKKKISNFERWQMRVYWNKEADERKFKKFKNFLKTYQNNITYIFNNHSLCKETVSELELN